MQTTNANPKSRHKDQGWIFLVEHSIDEFMLASHRVDEPAAGYLFQTMSDMGIPLECLKKMVRTLIEFVNQIMVQSTQRKREFPVVIRLFCQKRMIDEACVAKTSRPYDTEQALEHAPFIHHPGTKMNGGWGYFLIERGNHVPTGGSGSSQKTVDLYLYKEGE
jgi:hypothetical protein